MKPTDNSVLETFNTVVSRIVRATFGETQSTFDVEELHELRAHLSDFILRDFEGRAYDLCRIIKNTDNSVAVRSSAAFHLPRLVEDDERHLLDNLFDPNAPLGDPQIRYQFVLALKHMGFYENVAKFQNDPSQLVRDLANELK